MAEDPSGKDAPARGVAVLVYGLFLGGIMTLVTIPVGAALAAFARPRAAPWVDTHLRFQLRTFTGLLVGGVAFTALWWLLDRLGLPSVSAWTAGYLYATAALVWLVGRCAVGVHRLTSNRPLDAPGSLLFGGVRPTFTD